MNREAIINFLKDHKKEFEENFGVLKIGLFGSYARGESHEGSEDQKCEPVPDFPQDRPGTLYENARNKT